MDGTLTPARLPMTDDFAKRFLSWQAKHTNYLATGSTLKSLYDQLSDDVMQAFSGVYASLGNTFWAKGEMFYTNQFDPNPKLLTLLESFRTSTQYPYTLYPNYIENRGTIINFSVLGRDCPYEERIKYNKWDEQHSEHLHIQSILEQEFPEYSFLIGGVISIDITPKGCGKEQIAIALHKKHPYAEIVFFGDKIFPGGNDYALAKMLEAIPNTKSVPVSSPEEVLEYLVI